MKDNIQPVKDRQGRKYNLTFNNPLDMIPPMSHDEIKKAVGTLGSVSYWCLADEIGLNEHTPHTHLYLYSASPIRFSTIKKRFPQAHIELAYGDSQENRAYILKEGKWKNTEKTETSIQGTFEEFVVMPIRESMSARGELQFIYEMIESGLSTAEILKAYPQAMRYLDKIDRARQLLIEEKYKNTWRDLTVTYIFGLTETGKTRSIMEKYGYSNVFRITDYDHPFDSYKNNSVLIFEEFRSSIKIQNMLNYLDGYPCELPARYNNKTACYLEVYIITNIFLEQQYVNIQVESPETWKAFLRRIDQVIWYQDKDTIITYDSVNEYLERNNQFHSLTKEEQECLPFEQI